MLLQFLIMVYVASLSLTYLIHVVVLWTPKYSLIALNVCDLVLFLINLKIV